MSRRYDGGTNGNDREDSPCSVIAIGGRTGGSLREHYVLPTPLYVLASDVPGPAVHAQHNSGMEVTAPLRQAICDVSP
jgi:hypothetical protein